MATRHMLSVVLSVVVALMLSTTALAEIGQIKTMTGEVTLIRNNVKSTPQPGDLLDQYDIIETGKDGSLGITFIDGSRFSAGPATRLELSQFQFNPTTHEGKFVADIKSGSLSVISGKIAKHDKEAMKIKTPTTILGVRGTEFLVKVER
jgi:hypothetical protein